MLKLSPPSLGPYVKRTIRPLYTNYTITSTLPKAEQVDRKALEDKVIYPGMVATKLESGLLTVASLGDYPYGLFSNFINGDLNEIPEGHNEVGVWQMGTFEILWQKDYSPLAIDTWFGSNVGKAFWWNDLGQIVNGKQYAKQKPLGIVDEMIVSPGGTFRIQVDLRL